MLTTCAIMLASMTTPPAQAQTTTPPEASIPFESFTVKGGTTLRYVLLRPADATKPAPLLLALPPGEQSEAMCRVVVEKYWNGLAKAGWVVVCPAAPAGHRFGPADEDALLALAGDVASRVKAENGLVHLAGVSNGGISAVRLAADHADRFASLTLLPGAADKNFQLEKLKALAQLPAMLFVGEKDDEYWHAGSKAIVAAITGAGGKATLRVLPGQGHVLDFAEGELVAAFNAMRPGAKASDEDAVNKAIDALHDAAAKADEARYFGLYTPGAIFLGTDPAERWTSEAFHDWAKPYFARGSAWTYTPRERHVYFAPARDVAWFDETLDNAKLGLCRGSGVLLRERGEWHIAQYNLSVPVPNDLMGKVVEMIQAAAKKP
jgi:poly(3-hydroxybutyrate) depolymerase